MAAARRVHDRAVLDALEAIDPIAFKGNVWRVAQKGREPLRGSSLHGRWSPTGEFEVLYTSLKPEGALTEVGYRLSLEPVWPSRMEYELHRIEVGTKKTLYFRDLSTLQPLGVDVGRYQSFDYEATQAITAAAHFLAFDGLLVPSARAQSHNLVIFLDRTADYDLFDVRETTAVDWDAWRQAR